VLQDIGSFLSSRRGLQNLLALQAILYFLFQLARELWIDVVILAIILSTLDKAKWMLGLLKMLAPLLSQ